MIIFFKPIPRFCKFRFEESERSSSRSVYERCFSNEMRFIGKIKYGIIKKKKTDSLVDFEEKKKKEGSLDRILDVSFPSKG